MIGIYKITSPNNRIYIGQSRNIKKRFYTYKAIKCFEQTKLFASLKKYGSETHKFEVIHELPNDISQDILNNYEIFYWQQHIDCGYKMLNLREPGSNGKLSDETKKKISKSLLGKVAGFLGKKHSEESKKIMSEKRKGENNNRFGKKHSEETKKKMSESTKGNKHNIGKKHSEETKAKIRESLKKSRL